jgi:hypothetical protein
VVESPRRATVREQFLLGAECDVSIAVIVRSSSGRDRRLIQIVTVN